MASEPEEELALIVEVQFRGEVETILIPYRSDEQLSVMRLRESVAGQYAVQAEDVWLVFKGRKIRDDETVSQLGTICTCI